MQQTNKLLLPVILCVSTLLSLSSCSSSGKKAPEEKEVPAITKTKTAAHKNIEGTHLYMVPPGGFNPSPGSMKGFVKDEQTTFISVTEFPGRSFYKEAANNSADKIREKGYNVYLEQDKKVGPYTGRLMRIGDGSTSTVWQLVFGDSSFSAMVMGVYPSGDELSGKQIADALETVIYDKELVVDKMAGLNYSILPNESGYEYLKTEGGLAFYSEGGSNNLKNDNASFLLVAQVPREKGSAKAFAESILEATMRQNFENPDVLHEGPATINGNDAYEMEVEASLKGKLVRLYIAAIVKEKTTIQIQAIAKSSVTENINRFRKFARAISIE